MSKTIFRVIADEPVGFCVGFKPTQSQIDRDTNAEFQFDLDEWTLVEDDDSSATQADPEGATVVFNGDSTTNNVKIRAGFPTQEEIDADFFPVGPEMLIFRSYEAFVDFVNETYGN